MLAAADRLKRDAANAAVERFVESGATLGLGSGTTSAFVVGRIGEKLAAGELRNVRGVPTSEDTAALAREAGIPLVDLSEARPTLTLDGADEVGPRLATIKGLGGALLREKIVAAASRDGLILVADGSKAVDTLGTRGPLPVEVDPFGWETTFEALSALGCEPKLRMDAAGPFVTDGGHYTADCTFGPIQDPPALEVAIKAIPGALECGLFIGLARAAVIADEGTMKGTMKRVLVVLAMTTLLFAGFAGGSFAAGYLAGKAPSGSRENPARQTVSFREPCRAEPPPDFREKPDPPRSREIPPWRMGEPPVRAAPLNHPRNQT